MTQALRRWMWLLLCAGLTACATARPVASGDTEEGEVASFEALCADEGSLLPLCAGPQCGLYRCREVMARLTVGKVVPAYAEEMVLPLPGNGAQRYWGSSDGLPETSQPVFIIPWGPQPLLPSQQRLLEEQEAEWRKPHEKHHIFPQEEDLAKWFASKGINIHEYTMPLLLEVHRRIHHPPPKGGDWNEAWRKYQRSHFGAAREEIMRYAEQLIYEFGLAGPVIPYYRQWTQPPPIGG